MNTIEKYLTKYKILASLFAIFIIFNSNKVVTFAASLPAKGYIDAPANNAVIKGDLDVSGWFLDGSSVSKIEVLVDGTSIGEANYNYSRTDVGSAFPEYQNPNSGYHFTLHTKNLTNGQHTLTVKETGGNGSTTTLPNVAVTVKNPPTMGYIDSPASGAVLKNTITVSGWFLDYSGTSKIEVFIDGKSVGTANTGVSRQDVGNAFPEYQDPNSGYNLAVNTLNIPNGQHTLAVKETGNNGGTTTLQSQVNVQNPPAIGYIDYPTNGAVIKNTITVSGWFLDYSGVSKIEVLVDGKSVVSGNTGSSRTDVGNAFPEYKDSNSGYHLSLDTRTLPSGQHTLTIRETGNNGGTTTLPGQVVNVQNPPAIGCIDNPANGGVLKGDAAVSGWFLDPNGVNKVEVIVDGNVAGEAHYGNSRPDVKQAYPDYQNGSSGFNYTLDTRQLVNGQHTLTVRETANNGLVTELPGRTVNIQNPPPKGCIDNPASGAVIKGKMNVSGWFLDVSGIAKLEVFIDGKSVGQANTGIERLDVKNAFPEYQIANSGYQLTVETKLLTNGQHTLTVRETGNNGATTDLQSQVNIQNPPPLGYIEAPVNGAAVKDNLDVHGWFIDYSGVSKIEVLVDGNSMGQAQIGLPRSDVDQAYPEYQSANSGFQFSLDTRKLINGQHTITVRETGNNGAVSAVDSKINVQNPAPAGFIDSPSNASTIKGDTNVSGWFLDYSGVSKVEVLVDGTNMGQAQYGSARGDVGQAYPIYQNNNSGYQFTLNSLQFGDGQHTLTVKETGANGGTTSLTNTIYIYNGNPYTQIDLRKAANITAADIVNYFTKNRPSSPLKDYAQTFIDAQNKYGVNAVYLVAHAILETGGGTSDLYNYKHNLYGYNAYDVAPFTCAFYFPSPVESIMYEGYAVRRDYLDSTGSYYNGPNLTGMNVKYATDKTWATKIANLMQAIQPFDAAYYFQTSTLPGSSTAAPSFGRDIPAGLPYPANIIINNTTDVYATVVGSSLTLRTIPYQSASTVIKSVPVGTVVKVLGYNTDVKYVPGDATQYPYDNRWFRVSVDGTQGWLYGGQLALNQ